MILTNPEETRNLAWMSRTGGKHKPGKVKTYSSRYRFKRTYFRDGLDRKRNSSRPMSNPGLFGGRHSMSSLPKTTVFRCPPGHSITLMLDPAFLFFRWMFDICFDNDMVLIKISAQRYNQKKHSSNKKIFFRRKIFIFNTYSFKINFEFYTVNKSHSILHIRQIDVFQTGWYRHPAVQTPYRNS